MTLDDPRGEPPHDRPRSRHADLRFRAKDLTLACGFGSDSIATRTAACRPDPIFPVNEHLAQQTGDLTPNFDPLVPRQSAGDLAPSRSVSWRSGPVSVEIWPRLGPDQDGTDSDQREPKEADLSVRLGHISGPTLRLTGERASPVEPGVRPDHSSSTRAPSRSDTRRLEAS
jgi:hypothetical protein